jgi:hypothetical protein
MSETQPTTYTSEPIVSIPTHLEPNLPPQPYTGSVPETLLAIAILIRSIALLIHVLKSGPKK